MEEREQRIERSKEKNNELETGVSGSLLNYGCQALRRFYNSLICISKEGCCYRRNYYLNRNLRKGDLIGKDIFE